MSEPVESTGSRPVEGDPSIWQRVERLCQAAIRITAHHDLASVLQEFVDSARAVTSAQYAAIGILSPDGQELDRFVTSGVGPDVHERIGRQPRGAGILGLLIRDPRPLRLPNLSDHPASVGLPVHHPAMRAFLGVPILGREGPIGNLYLTEKKGASEFTETDQSVAVLLAAHAAVAVENARLFETQERLVADLKTANEGRDRFFAMVNHELRNAITGVYGWVELWMRKHEEGAPRAAVEAYESAERAVKMLEDLLDLSRLDASRLTVQLEPVDVVDQVTEAIHSIEPAASQRGVRVDGVGLDRTFYPVTTDALRLQQILINLLTNAVRHTPPGAAVTVSVAEAGANVQVTVEDRGEGISADQLETIFEAFERAGRETDRGTGLGLTLSRSLARLLGGDLRAESKVGHGARFILTLPQEGPDTVKNAS